MIKISKTYSIALNEVQAQQLYYVLLDAKDRSDLRFDGRFDELRPLYEELERLFATGVR